MCVSDTKVLMVEEVRLVTHIVDFQLELSMTNQTTPMMDRMECRLVLTKDRTSV